MFISLLPVLYSLVWDESSSAEKGNFPKPHLRKFFLHDKIYNPSYKVTRIPDEIPEQWSNQKLPKESESYPLPMYILSNSLKPEL